ncbi:hypothetical protein HRbin12_00372 [bacterium HR12]|nr:hypothetical protein HRbin12_00372 [bacterium HR12]
MGALLGRPTWPRPTPEDHALVRAELARLDPWSYWAVALEGEGADYAVVGRTGAFVVALVPLPGYVEPDRRGVRVGGVPLAGFRRVRRAARRVRGRLLQVPAFCDVEPVLCLTRAVAGAPRTVRGVRVVSVGDLAADLAARENAMDPQTARRAAEALGTVLPGGAGAAEEP